MEISDADLRKVFDLKYAPLSEAGWSPRRRDRYGYFTPSEHYEATVDKLITPGCSWVDVGGGRNVFPQSKTLSRELADRCGKLVVVDPSANVHENPYAHESHQSTFEDFRTEDRFDVATFRMVAEHISEPEAVVSNLKALMKPGGAVVIYTINKYSPIPIVTYLTPFSLHFKIKRFFWGGEDKDTFPVAYKMNTRKDLARLFTSSGFSESSFKFLDDLSALAHFRIGNMLEIMAWRFCKLIRVRYPENNLLGVYRRDA